MICWPLTTLAAHWPDQTIQWDSIVLKPENTHFSSLPLSLADTSPGSMQLKSKTETYGSSQAICILTERMCVYVLPIAPITEAHANLFAFLRARRMLCIISGAINPARVNLQIIARISPLLHRRRFAVDCHFAILSSSYRPGSAFLINQPFLIFRDCNYSYIRPPCPFVPAFLITPILC